MRALSAGSSSKRAKLARRAISEDVSDIGQKELKPKVNRAQTAIFQGVVRGVSVIILPLAWPLQKGLFSRQLINFETVKPW
jgi:hypothetical protein